MNIKATWVFVLTGLMIFWGGAEPESSQAVEVSSAENLQWAVHQGRAHGGRHERHQLHHGMGRAGSGICPQTRATPQAPDKFLKLKNPVESNWLYMCCTVAIGGLARRQFVDVVTGERQVDIQSRGAEGIRRRLLGSDNPKLGVAQ